MLLLDNVLCYTEHPQIVVAPTASLEVDAGTTVTYVCVAFGEDEPPNIFWQFGDDLLSNDSSELVTVYETQLEENGLTFTQSILELCSVELEDGGTYSCTANNSRGSNSSSFTLTVRARSKRNKYLKLPYVIVLSLQFLQRLWCDLM